MLPSTYNSLSYFCKLLEGKVDIYLHEGLHYFFCFCKTLVYINALEETWLGLFLKMYGSEIFMPKKEWTDDCLCIEK